MSRPVDLLTTQDGSKTYLSTEFGEPYHSRFGAVDESMHVFIRAGLQYVIDLGIKKINLLECGFGTGLNAFLSFLHCKDHVVDANIEIEYTALEAYPLSLEQASLLDYPAFLEKDEYRDVFLEMHGASWDHPYRADRHFQLMKQKSRFEKMNFVGEFHLVYYDAFAPAAQEELWNEHMMQKIYSALVADGILCTYCAKGTFKRALKSVGFTVESLPGPTGKREMTRATKA